MFHIYNSGRHGKTLLWLSTRNWGNTWESFYTSFSDSTAVVCAVPVDAVIVVRGWWFDVIWLHTNKDHCQTILKHHLNYVYQDAQIDHHPATREIFLQTPLWGCRARILWGGIRGCATGFGGKRHGTLSSSIAIRLMTIGPLLNDFYGH